ncbi:MAG: formylglycine-generating enzyme family protein, partial [Thermoguttaceae bacterium]
VEGQNCCLVDLFDIPHTIRVLTAFGRAIGALPASASAMTEEQEAFLQQAAAGLADGGKVVCVHLALFAEMMKSRDWTATALLEVGGAQGLGVAFLETTFDGTGASRRYRLHAEAARRILRALLPEAGVNIKGHQRSGEELLEIAGYAARPDAFGDLVEILSNELRLVTPADPERHYLSEQAAGEDRSPSPAAPRYYQLTHDYLVPSLREWLTAKDKETRRGRAQIQLAERAELWIAKPGQVRLPTLLEWLGILAWTGPARRTDTQRRMLRAAARFHLGRIGLALLAGIAASLIAAALVRRWEGKLQAAQARVLAGRLFDAKIGQVPEIVDEIGQATPYTRQVLADLLQKARGDGDPDRQLRASLALLETDPTQAPWLGRRLVEVGPQELSVVCRILAEGGVLPLGDLWRIAEDPSEKVARRFRAASALAQEGSEDSRWDALAPMVAEQLVTQNVLLVDQWKEVLRPRRASLIPPLITVFHEKSPERTTPREVATEILVDLAADRCDTLCELILTADEEQFVALYPALAKHRGEAVRLLDAVLNELIPPGAAEDVKDSRAKRLANAAVAIFRMGQPERVWPLLRRRPDPRLRNYLIRLLCAVEAPVDRLIERLMTESDVGIRTALILALAEYPLERFSPRQSQWLLKAMADMFRDDADPGVHGAAQWALRRWNPKALAELAGSLEKDRPLDAKRRWFVTPTGHTMVVIPGPIQCVTGAPPSVTDCEVNERSFKIRIGRSFAIADREVTWGQFEKFRKDYPNVRGTTVNPQIRSNGGSDSPIKMNWHTAAAYCRWLSEKEGIAEDQMCYPSLWETNKPLVPHADYLHRTGYRLPSEAEWEYACLGGAVTVYSCGNSPELLRHYGWTRDNVDYVVHPVGQLKPNDLGLFDMHGSLWEWCCDGYNHRDRIGKGPGEFHEDIEDDLPVQGDMGRMTRGGSYYDAPVYARAFIRNPVMPGMDAAGLRPART